MEFITRVRLAIIALIIGVIVIAGGYFLPEMPAKILFDSRNGGMYPFSIQNFMWLAFFLGLGELYYRYQHIDGYEQGLGHHYLPDDPQILLTPQDMPELYRSMAGHRGELEDIIRNLIMRFQAGHSVEQTHEMLNSQLDLWQYRLDIDYNMIRYLSWLIPTLGFLGTVVGIAFAMSSLDTGSMMNLAGNTAQNIGIENDPLKQLTDELGVAFYTTLVALGMSTILVFIMHIVQGREERAISQSGQYCLDGLITRLYIVPENQQISKNQGD